MRRCQHCGQGTFTKDANGPICADCIEEGYFEAAAKTEPEPAAPDLKSERDAALERVAVLEAEKATAQADALEGAVKLLRSIAGNMESSGTPQATSDAYRGAANKISRRAAKFRAMKQA